MLNIDTSDMISIGSFDYTINEAATLYMVDVQKGKPFYYLSPISTACIHGLIVRYFNGWGGESFETFDEFVRYVTRQIEAILHFATKIDVTNKTSAHDIKAPRKNEMNQSREYTPKEDVDYLAVQKALTEMKEQRPASNAWNPKASLKSAKVPHMEMPPDALPHTIKLSETALSKEVQDILTDEIKDKLMSKVKKATGAELRKKARELLTDKPKPKRVSVKKVKSIK